MLTGGSLLDRVPSALSGDPVQIFVIHNERLMRIHPHCATGYKARSDLFLANEIQSVILWRSRIVRSIFWRDAVKSRITRKCSRCSARGSEVSKDLPRRKMVPLVRLNNRIQSKRTLLDTAGSVPREWRDVRLFRDGQKIRVRMRLPDASIYAALSELSSIAGIRRRSEGAIVRGRRIRKTDFRRRTEHVPHDRNSIGIVRTGSESPFLGSDFRSKRSIENANWQTSPPQSK